jgi:BirA family biotin operon repressor/biotin-[acetyl-CoA-carboxylase] ligase
LRGSQVQNSVIGVGLNVNQSEFKGLQKQAISLALLLKKEMNLKTVLELFCKHFEALYLNLKQGKFELINKLYLNNLYRFNSFGDYSANGQNFRGKITGVEESGLLVMENELGEALRFNFKEVQFT